MSVMGVEGAARVGFLYQGLVADIAVASSSSRQWLKSVFITAIPEQSPLLWIQQYLNSIRVTFKPNNSVSLTLTLVDLLLYPGFSDLGTFELGPRTRPRRTCPVIVWCLQDRSQSPMAPRIVGSRVTQIWLTIAGLVERCLVLAMQGTFAQLRLILE